MGGIVLPLMLMIGGNPHRIAGIELVLAVIEPCGENTLDDIQIFLLLILVGLPLRARAGEQLIDFRENLGVFGVGAKCIINKVRCHAQAVSLLAAHHKLVLFRADRCVEKEADIDLQRRCQTIKRI